MTALTCLMATTQRQLDDALRIRWAVFGEELRLLGGSRLSVLREVDGFDTLETTVHLIVYADSQPVATTRLLLPNAEVARTTGDRLGISLEQKFDLTGISGPGMVLAESTRFCILKPWRNSQVLIRLRAGLYEKSRALGVTHWIGAANTETDSAEDADLAFRVAAHQGWVSNCWRVPARELVAPPATPTAPLYSVAERALAREGHLDKLRMPRVLSLFARKMGARFIGEPLYDMHFHRFAMPLVAALDDLPASNLVPAAAADGYALRAA